MENGRWNYPCGESFSDYEDFLFDASDWHCERCVEVSGGRYAVFIQPPDWDGRKVLRKLFPQETEIGVAMIGLQTNGYYVGDRSMFMDHRWECEQWNLPDLILVNITNQEALRLIESLGFSLLTPDSIWDPEEWDKLFLLSQEKPCEDP